MNNFGAMPKEDLIIIANCMLARIKELEVENKRVSQQWADRYRPLSFVGTLAGQVFLENKDAARQALNKFYEIYDNQDIWCLDVDAIDMAKGARMALGDAITETEYQELTKLESQLNKEQNNE
ncbi:hypothetical protein MN210_18975 [Psychrobacter raelei]|uniref:Phage protein n=1 Tax=Psychrobacter raelei TaxID=2565531 RepID=A0AAU6PU20_9GAMM